MVLNRSSDVNQRSSKASAKTEGAQRPKAKPTPSKTAHSGGPGPPSDTSSLRTLVSAESPSPPRLTHRPASVMPGPSPLESESLGRVSDARCGTNSRSHLYSAGSYAASMVPPACATQSDPRQPHEGSPMQPRSSSPKTAQAPSAPRGPPARLAPREAA